MTTIPVGETVDLIEFVNGEFAKIRWNRKTGYVLSAYLTRSPEIGSSLDLAVVKPVQNYSYEQMQADLATLAQQYPDLLTLSSIGKSEEGRDLTLCILGNPDAERRIFIQASIHGREHIVTLLALSEIDYLLSHQDMVLEDGSTVKDLLSNVAIHIVPMSNPDGVTISQTGKLPEKFVKIYGNSTFYATQWKANANGIDLNGNFDADWEDYESIYESSSPAFAGYKGEAPECASESKALAEYLRSISFDLILSYHTSGSLIYWAYDYDDLPEVNEKCYDIATKLAKYNGFILGEQDTTSTAGLKDYAIQGLKTPSLTMEFAISDAPAPLSEFEQIWARGKHTMLISAQWVLEQNNAVNS
jgi:g-D-glutamyl-meso-diaminopimelate peptidase